MERSFAQPTWWVLATGCAVAVGIASASVQLAGIAPLAISSLITGGVLGACLVALLRFRSLSRPPPNIAATIGLALIVVVAQHGWMYRDYCRQWNRVRSENLALALFRSEEAPKSITEYISLEASSHRIILWTIDAALVCTAAATIMLTATKPHSPDP